MVTTVIDFVWTKVGGLPADKETATRFHTWLSAIIVEDAIKGGEPVFPNSRLSVRHIGELLQLGEQIRREVLEDYPYLSDEDLEFAPVFAKVYPRVPAPAQVPDR